MNMFKAFENRISEAFSTSAHGFVSPISLRKLSRRAAREMERETYIIDGLDTAPALITVLVSADDDAALRPYYGQLTEELANFVEAQAARKEYVFTGKPLARFMVDASLRPGRFAVFANNVDAATLEKLREEEEAFLSGFGSFGGAASADGPGIVTPIEAPIDYDELPEPNTDDSAVGLTVMPDEYDDMNDSEELGQVSIPDPVASEPRPLAEALPEVMDAEANPIVTPLREVVGQRVPDVPEVSAGPAEIAVPSAPQKELPNTQDSIVGAAPTPVVAPEPVTCLLIDRQSGRTYLGTAPRTIIGRERTPNGIVLHDPNVSRRHAELTHDGSTWRVHDLGSTNGTLVNDVDVDTCVLRDGDLITLGLLNLEFRES